MSDQKGLAVHYLPHTEIIVCDWEYRYEVVNRLLNSPAHANLDGYSAKEVTIEPDTRAFDCKAKITVMYQHLSETLKWAPETPREELTDPRKSVRGDVERRA